MPTVPKEPRILLVEDASVMRKIELKALKTLGFEDILEAKDGDEAILTARDPRKELIWLSVTGTCRTKAGTNSWYGCAPMKSLKNSPLSWQRVKGI